MPRRRLQARLGRMQNRYPHRTLERMAGTQRSQGRLCKSARHDGADVPNTTFAGASPALRPAWDDAQIQDNTRRAVDVTNEIKRRFDAGELNAAEDLLAALSRSPDAGLTRRFLGELGRHELSIATGGRIVLIGGSTRFPRKLETRTVDAVVFG